MFGKETSKNSRYDDEEKKNEKKNEKEGKVYTEDEIEEIVAQRLKKEKAAWDSESEKKYAAEREEAQKTASMTPDERMKAELEKREKLFSEERDRYMAERMEFEATKALANENMPVSFARLLSGKDEESTAENVNLFKTEFLKAIENALNERLKGRTPKTSSVMQCDDPFLNGFGI